MRLHVLPEPLEDVAEEVVALRVVRSEPHRVARQRQRVAMRADILGEHEREVQHRVRVRRVERYRALEVRSRAR